MTQAVVVAEKPRDKVALIDAALMERRDALMAILPATMDYERFRRVATMTVAKNPNLLECEAGSLVLGIMEAAELGLEPTGTLGRAYLVPYNENVGTKQNPKWIKRAQLQIGYLGLAELARRSGVVRAAEARLVYTGDDFDVVMGTAKAVVHHPHYLTSAPSDILFAYALVWFQDGTWDYDVMPKVEIDLIRARSKAANNGPWVSDYGQMAKKTVLRRLLIRQPLTIETIEAISRDDEREYAPASVAEYIPPTDAKARGLAAMAKLRAPSPGEVEPSEPTVDEAAAEVPPAVAPPPAVSPRRRRAPAPEEAPIDAEIVAEEAYEEAVAEQADQAAVAESALAQKDEGVCGYASPWGKDDPPCELPKGHSLHHRNASASWPNGQMTTQRD